jgi:LuxR family maltose regulon positive regulatory protein
MLANGNASEALTCLEPLINLAEKEERFGSLVELWALKALAFVALEQFGEARDTVRRALQFGETGGFLRTFADEGPPMLALIESPLPYKPVSLKYQNSLRQVFGQETRLVRPGAVQPDELPEPVSQRELEVLRWISQGYSNQEIARRMVISISTVKTHVNNVFGKMGVKSRTEAVARAREIKLLD